jgi:hypothetical protein
MLAQKGIGFDGYDVFYKCLFEILIHISTSFQKSNIGWPQQRQVERISDSSDN